MAKSITLSLVLIGSLLTSSHKASAIPFTVDGNSYDVTTVTGTFNADASLLMSQPWWGNPTLASDFASAVGSTFGLPNLPSVGGGYGPFFAYTASPSSNPTSEISETLHSGSVGPLNAGTSLSFTYGIASRVAVPDGGNTLLMLATFLVIALGIRRMGLYPNTAN